jgi:hypothetical protein
LDKQAQDSKEEFRLSLLPLLQRYIRWKIETDTDEVLLLFSLLPNSSKLMAKFLLSIEIDVLSEPSLPCPARSKLLSAIAKAKEQYTPKQDPIAYAR